MKINKILALAAIAGMFTFSSCGDDEETKPSGESLKTDLVNQVLGAQGNAEPSYLNVSDGTRYRGTAGTTTNPIASDNGTKIDITYASLTAGSTFLSYKYRANASTGLTATVPSDANATYFKKSTITAQEFNNTNKTDDASWKKITVSTSSPEFVGPVVANDVIEFRRANGKLGIILVKDLETGLNGKVTFDVRSEKN
jgi:hypothetical protein